MMEIDNGPCSPPASCSSSDSTNLFPESDAAFPRAAASAGATAVPIKYDENLLKGVKAVVEVHCELDNRSDVFTDQMRKLGARVHTKISKQTTHLVYMNGRRATLQKALQNSVHVVSVLWIKACMKAGKIVNEKDFSAMPVDENVPLPYVLSSSNFKRFRNMQPLSMEEEQAHSAEKMRQKGKRDRQNAIRAIIRDYDARVTSSTAPEAGRQGRRRRGREGNDGRSETEHPFLSSDESSAASMSNHVENSKIGQEIASLREQLRVLTEPRKNNSHRRRSSSIGGSPRVSYGPANGSSPVLMDRILSSMPRKRDRPGTSDNNGREADNGSSSSQTGGKSMNNNNNNDDNSLGNFTDNTSASSISFGPVNVRHHYAHAVGVADADGGTGNRNRKAFGGTPRKRLILTDVSCNTSFPLPITQPLIATAAFSSQQQPKQGLNADDKKKRKGSGSKSSFDQRRQPVKDEKIHEEENQDDGNGKMKTTKKNVTKKQLSVIKINTGSGSSGSAAAAANQDDKENDGKRQESAAKTVEDNKRLRRRNNKKESSVDDVIERVLRLKILQQQDQHRRLSLDTSSSSAAAAGDSKATSLTQPQATTKTAEVGGYKNLTKFSQPVVKRKKLNQLRNRKLKKMPSPPPNLFGPSAEFSDTNPAAGFAGGAGPSSSSSSKAKTRIKIQSLEISSSDKSASSQLNNPANHLKKGQGSDQNRNRPRHSSLFKIKSDNSTLRRIQEGRPSAEEFLLPRARRSSMEFQQHQLRFKHVTNRRGRLPFITFTFMKKEDREAGISAVRSLKGLRVSEKVTEQTTHVILGESNKRTMAVLRGMALGAWLLPLRWVFESVEAGEWLPEEEYELWKEFPGCKKRRTERELGLMSDLLAEYRPIYVSRRCDPPFPELEYLIEKTVSSRKRGVLFIGPMEEYFVNHEAKPIVRPQWLFDSLSKGKAIPLENYLIK